MSCLYCIYTNRVGEFCCWVTSLLHVKYKETRTSSPKETTEFIGRESWRRPTQLCKWPSCFAHIRRESERVSEFYIQHQNWSQRKNENWLWKVVSCIEKAQTLHCTHTQSKANWISAAWAQQLALGHTHKTQLTREYLTKERVNSHYITEWEKEEKKKETCEPTVHK